MKNVTVIGSGSWGTALAVLLNANGHNVTLWSFLQREADAIARDRENKEFLPGIAIPNGIKVETGVRESLEGAEVVVCAVPSAHVRGTLERFAPYLNERHLIVNVAKGFDEARQIRLSQAIEELAPKSRVAVMSGPSHAEEVGRGIPTAIVAASADMSAAEETQDLFMNSAFRVYTNDDIVGVELGGALKNVIALVAGITDGLGFGDNTKAALMTRGMAEIARLGVAMGARAATFSGLSGLGDLIVTCTSMHSRNRRAGILIGEGHSLSDALGRVHMVVEGVGAARTAHALAKRHGVEMPICDEVNSVLYEGKDMKRAVADLMGRDKTSEQSGEHSFDGV